MRRPSWTAIFLGAGAVLLVALVALTLYAARQQVHAYYERALEPERLVTPVGAVPPKSFRLTDVPWISSDSRARLVGQLRDAGGPARKGRAAPEDRLPHGHDLGRHSHSPAARLLARAGSRAWLSPRRRRARLRAPLPRHRRRRTLRPRAQAPARQRPGRAARRGSRHPGEAPAGEASSRATGKTAGMAKEMLKLEEAFWTLRPPARASAFWPPGSCSEVECSLRTSRRVVTWRQRRCCCGKRSLLLPPNCCLPPRPERPVVERSAPAVACLADGCVVVGLSPSGEDGAPRLRVARIDGSSVTTVSTLAPALGQPGLAAGESTYLAAWNETVSGNPVLRAGRLDASGTLIGSALTLGASSEGSPAVAFDGFRWLVAWTRKGESELPRRAPRQLDRRRRRAALRRAHQPARRCSSAICRVLGQRKNARRVHDLRRSRRLSQLSRKGAAAGAPSPPM